MSQKTTVIVYRKGEGYQYDLFCSNAERLGVRCGLTVHEAGRRITALLACRETQSPDGTCLVAPAEILALIPNHLYDDAQVQDMPVAQASTADIEYIMYTLGRLVNLVYAGKESSNLRNRIVVQPLLGLGMMGGDLRAHPAQDKITKIINDLPSNLKDIVGDNPIPLTKQSAFWLGYYQSGGEVNNDESR